MIMVNEFIPLGKDLGNVVVGNPNLVEMVTGMYSGIGQVSQWINTDLRNEIVYLVIVSETPLPSGNTLHATKFASMGGDQFFNSGSPQGLQSGIIIAGNRFFVFHTTGASPNAAGVIYHYLAISRFGPTKALIEPREPPIPKPQF